MFDRDVASFDRMTTAKRQAASVRYWGLDDRGRITMATSNRERNQRTEMMMVERRSEKTAGIHHAGQQSPTMIAS